MKDNGWYYRLIKPVLELNEGMLNSDRMVGFWPEFQLLDYHLNEDCHSTVDNYCIIIRHLSDDDVLKFQHKLRN